MTNPIYPLLRMALIPLWCVTLFGQAIMYPLAVEESYQYEGIQHLALPYAALGIIAIIGLQVALVYIWKLSVLAERDKVFTDPAKRQTTGVIYGFAVFFGIPVLIIAHLVLTENAGGPGALIFSSAMITIGVALTFVLLVMRDLLGKAATMDQDLSGVI